MHDLDDGVADRVRVSSTLVTIKSFHVALSVAQVIAQLLILDFILATLVDILRSQESNVHICNKNAVLTQDLFQLLCVAFLVEGLVILVVVTLWGCDLLKDLLEERHVRCHRL